MELFCSRLKRKRPAAKAKNTITTEVQMLNKIFQKSFSKRGLVLSLVLMAAALGSIWLSDLRRDVFPDLSAPVFNVIVQNPAMGAEELETGVAIPMEAALAGLPEVRRIRSNSELGVTQITIEFEPDADYYRSRQFVRSEERR